MFGVVVKPLASGEQVELALTKMLYNPGAACIYACVYVCLCVCACLCAGFGVCAVAYAVLWF